MGDIRLSPRYGVNPFIPRCFICGKSSNEVALPGLLPGDAKATSDIPVEGARCTACLEQLRDYVALIGVPDNEPEVMADGRPNRLPDRTGDLVWVRRWVVPQVFKPESVVARILRTGVTFAPNTVVQRFIELNRQIEAQSQAEGAHGPGDQHECGGPPLGTPEPGPREGG